MVLNTLACAVSPVPLLADAALPLVVFTLPAVAVSLIPVILLEGFLLKAWIPTSTIRALKASALSNIASAIAGVPLASLLANVASIAASPWIRNLTQQEHWQSPINDVLMALANSVYISAYVGEAPWLLPAALLIILVPAFLISWWIEYLIVRSLLRKNPDHNLPEKEIPSAAAINRAVRRANFVSYVLLFAFIVIWLAQSQFSPHPGRGFD